jgi:hypothetical protein
MESSAYDTQYYEAFRNGSRESAQVIVPMILDWVTPASVIDVGCGLGDWLSVFQRAGVQDILGVDGDHVREEQLAIDPRYFVRHDLTTAYRSDRRYDLALSVEVAEHLPEECARPLIESLTSLAPVVLFSAAIPKQRGFHHVNCQWPDYWARLFDDCEFVALDCLRGALWNDPRVDWWYRQNLILYVSRAALETRLKLARLPRVDLPLALVHPEMLLSLERDLAEWGTGWEKKYWEVWAASNQADR